MKKMKTMRRVALLALSLLLVLVSLTACVGGNATDSASWTTADTDGPTYFSRLLLTNAEAREKFVAASRGYNMSAEGFDDSKLPSPAPDLGVADLEAAKAALEAVKPLDDASLVKFNEFRDALTQSDVDITVNKMKEAVALEPNHGLSVILVWIGKFLQILTNITAGNYVLGLFIFAVIVELAMLPLSVKQQKSTIKQAAIRPKEMAIRKKYAGRHDQKSMQKQQEELQRLYQEEGVNMMGGCLPLLIQMPIVIVLYNIVINPLRYVLGKAEGLSTALSTYCSTARAAGGLGEALSNNRGTIEILSKLGGENLGGLKDFAYFSNASECYGELSAITVPDFNLFGLNMGLVPTFGKPYLLLLIPVLTFVLYFISMKVNRKFTYQPAVTDQATGCSNNMMDITMPLMSTYICFIVPAAVGLYWMFKCVLTMAKQFVMHKVMPLPVVTEEDIKAAERVMKGKARPEMPARSGTAPRGPIRSLHHIDDDDDDLPPRVSEGRDAEEEDTPAEKRARAEREAAEAAKKEDDAASAPRIEGAPLKEDRKDSERQKK